MLDLVDIYCQIEEEVLAAVFLHNHQEGFNQPIN